MATTIIWDDLVQQKWSERCKAKMLPEEASSAGLFLIINNQPHSFRRVRKDRHARIVQVSVKNYITQENVSREYGWEENVVISEARFDRVLLTERMSGSSGNPKYIMSKHGSLLTVRNVPGLVVAEANSILERARQHNSTHSNRTAAELKLIGYGGTNGQNLVELVDYTLVNVY